jgi:phenylalanyl-tRNA synthetase beta chain
VAGSKEAGLDGVPADLLELKGIVEALRSYLRLPLDLKVENGEPFLIPGAQLVILDGEGVSVGTLGRIQPHILESFDIDWPVAVAEIRLSGMSLEPQHLEYQDFARFPAVKRDLSLLVPENVGYAALEEVVAEAGGPLLDTVELFDIYRGKGLPEGAGAFGIRLKFRSAKGNLKGKTVDRAIQTILEALSSCLGIEQRS